MYTEDARQYITFYEWCKDDGKLKKQLYDLDAEDFLKKFQEAIEVAKWHIHVKWVQANCYNDIKENLKENDVILHVDYSESYERKHQNKAQRACFDHTAISIFTACCYLKDENGKLEKESVTLTSELSDHSRSAAITCVMKMMEFIREKHQHLPLHINVYVWSDGCASQFRSRFVFSLLSTIDSSINLSQFYNKRHHSKGPMDGIEGTMKNLVFRNVKLGKCIIETPKDFAQYTNKSIKRVSSLNVPTSDIMQEP